MYPFDLERIYSFLAPSKQLVGKSSASQVGAEVKTLGGRKALIVTDPGVIKAGLHSVVVESLKKDDVDVGVYDGVEPEPPARVVDDAVTMARDGHYDIIVGIGGGSSLDAAKGVALMVANEGKILDYAGLNMFRKRGIPKVLIPTTAGTGSEATWVCVLTDENENSKKSFYSTFLLPELAILDPSLTVSLPPSVTADTGLDALTHAIESYVSVNRTPYSEIMAREAVSLISANLPRAYAKSTDMRARHNMLLASNLAGMAFTSGGLGATHGLAYPLGTRYHMAHGRSNAIMLPHVMSYNLIGNLAGYRDIAELMGEEIKGLSLYEAAELAVLAVKRLLAVVNISSRLSDYGIKEEDVPLLAEEAMRQSRFFVPNPRNLSETDIKGIYEKAYG